jgi:hypothetical protein
VTATGHEAMDTDTADKMGSETYILGTPYQIEIMANLDKVHEGALIVVRPKVRKDSGSSAGIRNITLTMFDKRDCGTIHRSLQFNQRR